MRQEPVPSNGAGARGWSERRRVAVICLALAAMTFAVFGQTLRHNFVNFDDNEYVYDNPAVAHGLTLRGMAWAFSHYHSYNWHPVTWISHELDCQLYGLHPWGHHLTNVLLHTATILALFLVLRNLTGALWRSAFAAALFGIHPLRVESVAWVAERKDVLSGLFFMLTIAAYARYARRPWSWQRYGLVMFLFALGLMSKPMLVTLPVVLLLLDYWPLRRTEPWKRLVLEKLPLFALSIATGVVTLFAQQEALQSVALQTFPFRISSAVLGCWVYLRQMFYPVGLAVYYPLPPRFPPAWIVAATGVLAGLSILAWALRRRHPWLLMGWLWYVVMSLPILGILQVGWQAHADRYTYLPEIGIAIALTWLAAEWRMGRAVQGGLMTAVLAVLMICAGKQTAVWHDSETLWLSTLARTRDNALAHLNLGAVYLGAKQMDKAIAQFKSALQINPNSDEAHVSLARAYVQQEKDDDAIAQCILALQINPNNANAHDIFGSVLVRKGQMDAAAAHFRKALRLKPDMAEAYVNFGNLLLKEGNARDAMAQFLDALQIDPYYAQADYNLGNILFDNGRVGDAIGRYQRALQSDPDYTEAHVNLGNALLQTGDANGAVSQYERALQIAPNFAPAHVNLGVLLLQKGNMDDALVHLQTAVQLKPGMAEAHRCLGDALFQKGRRAEAIAQYQQALALAQTSGQSGLARDLNNELKLRRDGQPPSP